MSEKRSFDEVWNSPKVKRIIGAVYSLGASVVIIGAMFKILHLPGAGVTLGIGMVTEAILFAIGIFDAPHVDYHWDHVFPALTAKEPNPLNYNGTIGGNGLSGGGNFGGPMLPGMEKLSESEAKSLTESIKNMSETAAQLANISRVAEKQTKLDEASNSLLSSYSGIASNMASAQDNTKAFAERASELSKNLGSINTAYELQLKGIQSQASAIESQNAKINAVTTEFEKLQSAVNASAKNMDAYRTMTDQLAKNISDLNNVYGNMLNALKA